MLICLDFDGVLVDSFDALLAMMVAVQADLGLGRVPVADDFRSIEQLSFDAVARRIGLVDTEVDRFVAGMLARQSHAGAARPFPGVVEALAVLARQNVLVVVTANHADVVVPTLAGTGLDSVITAVYGSEGGLSKARRIEAACHCHAVAPRETVMVGDAVSDLHAGRAAGVFVAAATWGYQPRERLATVAPDCWLDSPGDLITLPEHLSIVSANS